MVIIPNTTRRLIVVWINFVCVAAMCSVSSDADDLPRGAFFEITAAAHLQMSRLAVDDGLALPPMDIAL